MIDFLKKCYNKILQFGVISFFTIFTVILYIGCWFANTIYTYKFNLKELLDLYNLMIPQIVKYGLDSIFNSPFGSSKDKDGIAYYVHMEKEDDLKSIDTPNPNKLYFARNNGKIFRFNREKNWVLVLNPIIALIENDKEEESINGQ